MWYGVRGGAMTTISVTKFFVWRFEGLGPDETIEIRSFRLGGGAPRQTWHATPLEAAQAALSRPEEHEAFYGVNARQRGGGKAEHVTLIRGLWADQDYKHYADGATGAARALAAFPLQPTAVVASGGGNHLYWQLATPVAPSPAIEALLLRLYAALVPGDGKLDSVQDPSRILRVPGTLNHKTNPARLVTIRDEDPERCYTLDDFETFLPVPVEQPRPSWSPPTGAAARAAFDAVPSYEDMREILRHIPPGGDYTADWLRILAAVHTAYPGNDGIALCEEWCPGKPGEVARKFASFKRDGRATNATSIGTLIYAARQRGYCPPRPDAATFTFTAAEAGPSAVPLEQVRAALFALQQENEELRRDGERTSRLLAFCKDEHKRKDARIEALETRTAALEAAISYPDSTIGGGIFDVATDLFKARARGDSLVEDGGERHRVCFKTAANWRSASTGGNCVRKLKEHKLINVTERKVQIETERFAGEVDAAYVEIPEHCDTPEKFVLHLLKTPIAKKHGGNRRIEVPTHEQYPDAPVKRVTRREHVWRSLVDDTVLKIDQQPDVVAYFTAQGEEMAAEAAISYQESVGTKVNTRVPQYRPLVQRSLSEADRELVRPVPFDLDAPLPPPIPLRPGVCRACGRPSGASGYCERHSAILAMAAGAD